MASIENKLKRLHILHLSPFPYYSGGIDTWLINFLTSFDGKYQITIYCTSPKEGMKPIHDIQQLQTVDIKYLNNFYGPVSRISWALKTCITLFNRFTFNEKIIVLSTPTMLPIIFLKLFNRIKGEVILSVRGQLSQDAIDMDKSYFFQKIVKIIERKCISSADRIIVNGWDTKDFVKDFFGVNSDVIPNGYLPKKNEVIITDKDISFVQELKSQGKLIISHVGTVRRVKCVDFIFEAIQKLPPAQRERAAFIFVGKGMIEEYRKITADLGIDIFFLGEKRQVQPYYEMSDYIINVSGGSGVSNSLIEALSAGCPVIVWDNKTFTQVIEDGINGITCQHRNVSALSRGIQRSLDEVNSFNVETIKATAQDYQWDKIAAKWKILLQD